MKTQKLICKAKALPYKSLKGFNIIEAVVACVILGILVIGIINLFPVSSRLNARADRQAEATLLAEEMIELFRATPFDTLKASIAAGNDSGSQQIDADGIPGGWKFIRSWALIDSGNIVQVEVRCSWPIPGLPTRSTVRLVTQISNYE